MIVEKNNMIKESDSPIKSVNHSIQVNERKDRIKLSTAKTNLLLIVFFFFLAKQIWNAYPE